MTLTLPRAMAPICAVFFILAQSAAAADVGFPSGVMSGDVTDTTAICWTQTTAAESLRLDVATDGTFTNVVYSAFAASVAGADLTAKLDVPGLRGASRYFFRFV